MSRIGSTRCRAKATHPTQFTLALDPATVGLSTSSEKSGVLHVICGRDVGLFNLILSVIPHVHWAFSERRIPIVYYREGNCYWTPNGYRDRDTVWEYYFEPVVPDYPASNISPHIRELISVKPPNRTQLGYFADPFTFISNRFTGFIPINGERINEYVDPSDRLRQTTSAIMRDYIRPRSYITEKVDRFFREHLAGRYVIGIHVRGTDALVDPNRIFDKGAINFRRYFAIVDRLLRVRPDARIFVASDAQCSVDQIRTRFGKRVIAYDSIRHESGEVAGRGPNGGLMPAYLTRDPNLAARSGEEAVIEYLLLCRCNYLVHNGSSMPRAVLLTVPGMLASNTLPKLSFLLHASRVWRRRASRAGRVWRHRAALARNTISGKPIRSWYHLLRELWITKRGGAREAS